MTDWSSWLRMRHFWHVWRWRKNFRRNCALQFHVYTQIPNRFELLPRWFHFCWMPSNIPEVISNSARHGHHKCQEWTWIAICNAIRMLQIRITVQFVLCFNFLTSNYLQLKELFLYYNNYDYNIYKYSGFRLSWTQRDTPKLFGLPDVWYSRLS